MTVSIMTFSHRFVHLLFMQHCAQHSIVLIPEAVPVSSLMCPHFHLDGTMRPEWHVPALASLQTHAMPFDIPDGPAPALWPY